MDYRINLGAWGSVFAVPSELVDKHLRLAGVVPLKVMLYILRNGSQGITTELLSSELGYSADIIDEAVNYWVECGLVCSGSELTVPAANARQIPAQPAETPSAAQKTSPGTETRPARKKSERMRYSYGECVDMISSDESLGQMLGVLEGIMSKQLNHSEISAYVTLVRWYGMPTECVAIIAEHCKSIGKSSAAYVESMTIGLAEKEINTIDKVHAHLERAAAARKAWNKVRALLEIPERMPTAKESEISMRWVEEYGTGDELIKLAYELCVNKKGKLSLSYMDGIIKNWRLKGITTADEAIAESAQKQGSKNTGRFAPTYDTSEIDDVLDSEWLDDD